MNMHFFLPHIYLLSLGLIAWKQLRSTNCALYDRIAKENISKISIKDAFSFRADSNSLQRKNRATSGDKS